MENSSKNTEKMFRLMNHDSSHTKPQFSSYTIEEHNCQYGTNYTSVEEAINADPEYLFTATETEDFYYAVYDKEDSYNDGECLIFFDTEEEARDFVNSENAGYGYEKFFYTMEDINQ